MRNATIRKLVEDSRLDCTARVVAFFVGSRGKGIHEISQDELGRVLRVRDPRVIRRAVADAEYYGWVRVTKGGGGNANSYEFLEPSDHAQNAYSEQDQTVRKTHTLSGADHALRAHSEGEEPESSGALRSDHAQNAQSERTVVVVEEEVVVVEEDARAREGKFRLDGRVQRSLEGPEWDGCRSSIRDYFTERVETGSQHGYLMTLATWKQGSPTGPPKFGGLDPQEQNAVIASSLNELRTENEAKDYRSSKGKVGSTRTLWAKLSHGMNYRLGDSQAELPLGTKSSDDAVPPGYARDPAGRLYKRMDD